MHTRLIAVALLAGTISASADEASDVRFSAKELENVYAICAVHGAGTYMMPCVNVQIDKLKAGKEVQINNRKMEALTRQELMGHDAPGDATDDR